VRMILACPAAAGKTEVRTPASKSGTRCPSCGAWVRSRSTAARTSSGPPRACCRRGRTGRGPAGARCSTQRAYRRHALNGGAKVRDQGLAEGVALLSTCLSRSRYRVSRALVGLNLLFFDDLVTVVALRLGRLFPSRRSHLVGRLDRIVSPAGSRRRRWGRLSSSKKPRRRRSARAMSALGGPARTTDSQANSSKVLLHVSYKAGHGQPRDATRGDVQATQLGVRPLLTQVLLTPGVKANRRRPHTHRLAAPAPLDAGRCGGTTSTPAHPAPRRAPR
jgi:hypothetical protein